MRWTPSSLVNSSDPKSAPIPGRDQNAKDEIAFFIGADEQNGSGDGDVNSGRVLRPCRPSET